MQGKMVTKRKLFKSISLHGQRLNYGTNVCKLEDHVGEKGWSSNWLTKLGLMKEIPPTSCPNRMLKIV